MSWRERLWFKLQVRICIMIARCIWTCIMILHADMDLCDELQGKPA